MKFVILHGTSATSADNWFPWLKGELESRGHEVWAPDLPDADKPDVTTYNKFLLSSGYDFSDAVVIGHSSGAIEINGLLQELPEDVVLNTAILVGVFKGDLDWDSLKAMDIPYSYERIKKHARTFIVVHSEDDPYCPFDDAKDVAKQLDAEFISFKDLGHFSIGLDARFTEFPELIKILEERSIV